MVALLKCIGSRKNVCKEGLRERDMTRCGWLITKVEILLLFIR